MRAAEATRGTTKLHNVVIPLISARSPLCITAADVSALNCERGRPHASARMEPTRLVDFLRPFEPASQRACLCHPAPQHCRTGKWKQNRLANAGLRAVVCGSGPHFANGLRVKRFGADSMKYQQSISIFGNVLTPTHQQHQMFNCLVIM
eukprot:1214460-Amphidinium_carterae.2